MDVTSVHGLVRIAVMGSGSIGTRHLSVLGQIAGVHPIAVPRRRERIGDLKKEGYTVVNCLEEAVELGAKLCVVATDTGRHVEDGLAAIRSGLDVLVEKPLAATTLEARRLWRAAQEADRKVFVGCALRFSESLNTFKTLLGRIGRLHAVRIECQSYLPDWRPARPFQDSYSARADEGGVLRDLIHEIDYAGWLFGWPVSVQARVRNLGRLGIAADETADLTWECPEGCVVSVRLDYLTRPPRRRMIAAGEWGTLEWDGMGRTVALDLVGEPTTIKRSTQTVDEMLLAEDRAFINASCGYPDPHLAAGEDGVRALAVCDAARHSARTGHEEKVEYL